MAAVPAASLGCGCVYGFVFANGGRTAVVSVSVTVPVSIIVAAAASIVVVRTNAALANCGSESYWELQQLLLQVLLERHRESARERERVGMGDPFCELVS